METSMGVGGSRFTSIEISEDMFCRICGFRVRVWESYRTHRSSGYCGTGAQNSQKFREGTKNDVPYPGIVARGVQISQKFQVRV